MGYFSLGLERNLQLTSLVMVDRNTGAMAATGVRTKGADEYSTAVAADFLRFLG